MAAAAIPMGMAIMVLSVTAWGQPEGLGVSAPPDADSAAEDAAEPEEPAGEEPAGEEPAAEPEDATEPEVPEATAAAAKTAADEPVAEEEDIDESGVMGGQFRRLGGHNFITPTFLPNAFTNTSFQFYQGFGYESFDGENAWTGEVQDAQAFAYGQGLQMQIGILNRVSVDLVVRGLASVGGDLDTILTSGALMFLDAGGRAKVRIFTLDDVGLQLAAGVGVFYLRDIKVSPGEILEQARGTMEQILAGDITDIQGAIDDLKNQLKNAAGSLVKQEESALIRPTVMAAQGVGPFGAQVAVTPNIAMAGEGSAVSLDAGAHVALDIHELTSAVPVALTAEYIAKLDFEAGETGHIINGGLFYSGRRDFSIGMVAGPQLYPGFTVIEGDMVMQYFF